jgi:hypothetical protein
MFPAKRLDPLVLMADMPRLPDAGRSILWVIIGKARAKQKGRDECVPSRPTLVASDGFPVPRPANTPVGRRAYSAQNRYKQG